MKTGFLKIGVLLAASNITHRELLEFAAELERIGPKGLVRHVDSLKALVESAALSDFEVYTPSQNLQATSAPASTKIKRLLLEEARLPKVEAMHALASAVLKRHPDVKIPSDSRKGFSAWLLKLINVVSESELLYMATTIRNKYVHEAPTDWRLK
jgi:hypothetical protein